MDKITNANLQKQLKLKPQISKTQEEKSNSIFDSAKQYANEVLSSDIDLQSLCDENPKDSCGSNIKTPLKNNPKNTAQNASSSKQPETDEVYMSEIEQELLKLESEAKTKADSKIGFGALWNGVKGIFNKGSKGELSKINQLKQEYQSILENPDKAKIEELYFQIFNKKPDSLKAQESVKTAQELENGITLEDGQTINKENVVDLMTMQGQMLEDYFDNTVKSQGVFSKGLGWLNNNILGMGTTQNITNAQIENYQNLIQQLNDTQSPEEFSSLYKAITGEELNAESLNTLLQGQSKVENSKAAETIMDYESAQKTILTTTSGVASGLICTAAVAAAPFTGGASLALGAGVGAGSNVLIKGTDSLTRTNGEGVLGNFIDYAKKDFIKDAALGTINGFATGVGNVASSVVKVKVATTLTGALGGKISAGTINAGARITGEFIDGVADGMISNAGEYAIDCVADDEKKFKLSEFKNKVLLGGAMGGVMSVGMQEGIGALSKAFKDSSNDFDLDKAKLLSDDAADLAEEPTGFIWKKKNKYPNDAKYDISSENINNSTGYGKQNISSVNIKNIDAPIEAEDVVKVINNLVDMQKLPEGINYQLILNNPGKISNEFYDDLTKLQYAYSNNLDIKDVFVQKFSSLKNAKAKTQIGDVCQIDGSDKIAIKLSNGKMQELNLSAEKYLELFPPVKRFATSQGGVGDCYLVSGMDLMFKTPETRANILNCFTQEADGSVKIKIGDAQVKFERGVDNLFRKDLNMLGYRTNIDGCDGFKMLEETFGFAYIDKKSKYLTEKLSAFAPDSVEYKEAFDLLAKLQDSNKYIGDIGVEARGNAGYSKDVLEMFGLKGTMHMSGENAIDYFLKNKKNWDNYIITAGTTGKADTEFLNEGLKIAQRHAYGVQPYLSDGNTPMFKVTNPWDCGSNLDLTLDEFKKYFTNIDIARKR